MTGTPTELTLLLSRLAGLAGPLFDKELRVSSRQRRLYGLRVGYVCLLTLVVIRAYAMVLHSGGSTSRVVQISQMGEIGKGVIATIVWFQFVTGQILAAVLLGGSIAGEIRQRSFDVLLTTPISSFQIVVGKLTSKLLQVVTFLAISLPMLAIVRVFGGVPWDFVLSGLCITLTASVFVGALGLLFSVSSHRTQQVVGNVLGWCIIVWAGLSGALAALAHAGYVQQSTSRAILELFNPVVVMVGATGALFSSGAGPSWGPHCLVMLGATAVVLWLAVWRVRRARWITFRLPGEKHPARSAAGSKAEIADGLCWWRRGIRPVTGSPIVWKEMRKGVFLSRCRTRWDVVRTVIAVGLVFGCGLVMLVSGYVPATVVFFGLAFVTFLGFMLGIIGASASAYTQEKEARTWPILLATPLSDGEIVRGKAIGSVARHWPLPVLAAVLALAGIAFGSHAGGIPPEAVMYIIAWLARTAGTVVFLVALASYFGICMRSTAGAVVATVAIYLGSRLAWTMLAIPFAIGVGRESLTLLMFVQAVIYGLIGIGVIAAATRRVRRRIFI